MCAWFRALRLSAPTGPTFSLSSLGRVSSRVFPELHSAFKASSVRLITRYLADLCYSCHNPASEHSRLRTTVTYAMADFKHAIENAGLLLTADEQRRGVRAGRLFLLAYQKLSSTSAAQNEVMWKIRPKFHSFWHILRFMLICRINPHHVSCVRGEDGMGKFKKIAKRCHKRTMSARFLQRYMVLAMYMRW